MSEHLATFQLERAEDVFALRQSGRLAARAVGCDEADQVRFATALSEIGRELLGSGRSGAAKFTMERGGAIVVSVEGFLEAGLSFEGATSGLNAARRLIDDVSIARDDSEHRSTVVVRRAPLRAVGNGTAESLRNLLYKLPAREPLDELRLQNRDLVMTLQGLTAQREELIQLNAELEETNRGVMAMYAQLQDELAETNRGVVALYAELDEKTQKLREASDTKSRFLASVSHELRSPLGSILGLTRLMLESPDREPADRKELNLVLDSATSLLRLVNDLLDLAKAESGRLEPSYSTVDLTELFVNLRGSLRPLAFHGVELIVETPHISHIETDGTLLGQVLRNLLTNALKFTTEGVVRLSTNLRSQIELEMIVSDSGIGISESDQSKVFEEFYQVRGAMQSLSKGTGLGLPFANRVTEALGGKMRLESRLGRGSTFTVTLPIHPQPLLNATLSRGPASGEPIMVGKVLIVDDDEAFRSIVRGLLQGTASQVFEASDGAEGLGMMRAWTPDLVFMDLRMPRMDGAEVMTAMAADPPLREIPVIIVTSADLDAGSFRSFPPVGAAVALMAKANLTKESLQAAIQKALTT